MKRGADELLLPGHDEDPADVLLVLNLVLVLLLLLLLVSDQDGPQLLQQAVSDDGELGPEKVEIFFYKNGARIV